MQIVSVGGYVTVDKVFPNTPAESRGVMEGDRIAVIDTVQARGWSTQDAQNKLLGEVGTSVTVTFLRPGMAQPLKLDVKRAEIHVPAVPYRMMLDDRVGYVPLLRFSEQTTQDITESVIELRKKGAKGIVIDLRGNPGGILEEAFAMSNLFLPKGKELLSVRGRGEYQKFVAEREPLALDIPLVVLVDGGSASASEIVAGALQDYDRALVLGTTSYGKGLVQSIYNLDGGYALKITTGKWYTPSGRSIQKERKFNADGQFVEVASDSIETDSARKARPAFKSASGRVVYGGGAITPDLMVAADTISTKEQALQRAMAPYFTKFFNALGMLAQDQKGKVKPDFTPSLEWREDLYRRLTADTVKIDKAVYDAGGSWTDRYIEGRVARVSFGDSTAKRHELKDDNQLRKAVDLLRKSTTQKDVFAAAAAEQPSRPALAKSSRGGQQ
jgi:carboxyl-terminal processing protease